MTWQSIDTAPRDSSRVLLAVEFKGKKYVRTGGWDNHWSGQRWVYDGYCIPTSTEPFAWMPLPAAPEAPGYGSDDERDIRAEWG